MAIIERQQLSVFIVVSVSAVHLIVSSSVLAILNGYAAGAPEPAPLMLVAAFSVLSFPLTLALPLIDLLPPGADRYLPFMGNGFVINSLLWGVTALLAIKIYRRRKYGRPPNLPQQQTARPARRWLSGNQAKQKPSLSEPASRQTPAAERHLR